MPSDTLGYSGTVQLMRPFHFSWLKRQQIEASLSDAERYLDRELVKTYPNPVPPRPRPTVRVHTVSSGRLVVSKMDVL
jgi:hypothetical protein